MLIFIGETFHYRVQYQKNGDPRWWIDPNTIGGMSFGDAVKFKAGLKFGKRKGQINRARLVKVTITEEEAK